MIRLIISISVLAFFVTPVSAEIIPACQWLSESYPEYYVTKRANVRDAPNTQGKILATLPPGSVVYTNERTRTTSENPEKWYTLLATKSLPPFSGCAGGHIHPSLVSKIPPSTQEANIPPATVKTIIHSDGDRYRGQMRNGKMHGRGVYTYASGARYEGEFRDGYRHGRGVSTSADGKRRDVEEWRWGKRVSTTTLVASQEAEKRREKDQKRGDNSDGEGALWGAIVISSRWEYRSDKHISVAWKYPSRSAAIEAAIDRCASKSRSGDCGQIGAYSAKESYVTHVAFSSAAQRHDSSLNYRFRGTSFLAPGFHHKQRGHSFVIRNRCALVWSELEITEYEPNTPVTIFADTEAKARAAFSSGMSRSAAVSSNWRNELTIYCNDP